MTDPRIEQYLAGLNGFLEEPPELRELREEAEASNIPAVRPETARLLYFLTAASRPSPILEIGTGSGLSAAWMRRAAPSARIVTLERDRNRYERAKVLFAGDEHIRVEYADAFNWLAAYEGEKFGLVFLDAQKRDYVSFLRILPERIAPGGLLVADNTLFGGRVVQADEELEEKYVDGVRFVREFNETFARDARFDVRFFGEGDGLAAWVRK